MRDSFVFYSSYYEAISEFDEKTQLQIFKAVCEYALNGNIPELSGISKAIFTLIKPTIDANEKRYNNGKKGGRPKKNNSFENQKPMVLNSETNGFENQKPNVNVNVNETENVNVYEYADEESSPSPSQISEIIDLYHKICTSYPKVAVVSDEIKKSLKNLIGKYSVEQIRTVFETAEKSDFLKGNSKKDWKASFEWLVKEKNFVKVLNGNYNNPQKYDNSNGFNAEDYNIVVNNF